MKYKFSLVVSVVGLLMSVSLFGQGIKSGPWISGAAEDQITILWTSEVPGMAFVELEDGTVKYETFAGRRIFQRLHSVTIDNLQRGSVVKYRVCGQNLKDDSNARKPEFGDTYKGDWQLVRTMDSKANSCRFSVFNDVHMRIGQYSQLASQIDSAATDFIFLNGDIASAGNYVLDSLVKYEIEPLGSLTHGLPIFFARGNHEGRGNNVKLVADIFPNAGEAPFYYTFRQGPVAFIVLDAGETGKSRSILFSGGDVYEDYLNEQIEWAAKAMREPWFRKAPVKVCLLHVPMIDHPDKDDYLLQRWLNVHFVPLLNKAGIDFMIGADLHEFMLCDPGTMNNRFPIIVNNEIRRMDFEYKRGGTIDIKTYHPSGKLEFERSFKVR